MVHYRSIGALKTVSDGNQDSTGASLQRVVAQLSQGKPLRMYLSNDRRTNTYVKYNSPRLVTTKHRHDIPDAERK